MGLPNDDVQDIVLASMLHDIGAFSIEERKCARVFEAFEVDSNPHALVGYRLLKCFEPLQTAAELIKDHHTSFHRAGNSVAIGSHIIHLADRASLLFDEDREILTQIPQMLETILKKQTVFHPDTVEALKQLSQIEYVWIETFMTPLEDAIQRKLKFSKEIIDLETLRSFARFIARIIDFRCRFTSTHSSGVAAVAMELAAISGFSERECKQMEIAGFMHDLGKLAVPSEILEKNGPLDIEEISVIKKHTYYTHTILSKVSGLEQIAIWAAYHHERQDGNGYPFHIHGRDFPKLARIMAVADIMTALSEDRPYRLGMSRENTAATLYEMAESGAIDKNMVRIVDKNFNRINATRITAQEEARKDYESFHYEPYVTAQS